MAPHTACSVQYPSATYQQSGRCGCVEGGDRLVNLLGGVEQVDRQAEVAFAKGGVDADGRQLTLARLGGAVEARDHDQSGAGRAAGRADQLVLAGVHAVDKTVDEVLIPGGDPVDTGVEKQLKGGDPRQRGGKVGRAEDIEGSDAEIVSHGRLPHVIKAPSRC